MNTSLLSLRSLVLLIFCLLAIAGIVFASGHSDQSGDPPPPCPPDCEECCQAPGTGGPPSGSNPPPPPPSGPPNSPGFGGNGPSFGPGGPFAASTSYPVHLLNGSVTERVTDISIDGPLGGWKHRRTYNSMLDTRTYNNINYNINGRRWSNNAQSIYLRRSGNTMELFLTASSKRIFTDNDPDKVNGTYSGPSDFNATLTKSVALSYLVYTLTFLETGEVYIFKEKDPLDPCWGLSTYQNDIIPLAERTNLTYLTQGLIGETYFYNNNRQLVLVVTASPQSYFIKYSYYVTGYVSGYLKKIEVYDGSPELDTTTKTAEAEYLYVDYQNASDYVGTTGDLAQVRVSELLTDGVTWDHQYTQYRYYLYDGRGYYQLESVLEPEAIERIIAENSEINVPEDIFNYYSNNYDYYYYYNGGQTLSSGKTISDYSSRVFTYYDYTINTNSNISTVWGTENLSSKYGGNDRNEVPTYPYLGLVKSESVNTGCSSCGGSSSGGLKMNYYYMTLNSVPSADTAGDSNIVVYLTIEDTLDSADTPLYRTIYGMNWHGIELRRAVIKNPDAATLDTICTSRTLNERGNIIEEHPAEVHALVNTNTLLKQFLNPYNGSSWANNAATLEQSKGIIYITEYDSITNKKSGSKVKIGSGGTAYYTLATDYNAQGHVSAHHVYPTQTTNRSSSDRVTTSYTYTYWEDNFKQSIKTRTDTSQAVPVLQNGSGVSAVTQTYYDSYGNIRWTCDPLGVVTYYGYHPITTQRTLIVRDIDTGSLPAIVTTDTDNVAAWNGNVPFNREASLPTAFNQTITTEYDKRGHIFETTNPDSVTSYTVRGVKKTIRFSAWDITTQQPVLPITVIETNAAGKILESYQLPPAAVTVTNEKPSGVSASAAKVAWTKYTYHSSGLLQHVDRYHVIPTSGTGTLGTNFYRTTSIYDTLGRLAATAQFAQTGKWQVDYRIYDWQDRVTEVKRGVAMNPPVFTDLSSATWLKIVSKTIYDGERIDKSFSFFDTGTNDYTGTKYYYDQWNRVRSTSSFAVVNSTETPLAPFTVQDYNWRGNVIDIVQFESEPDWNNVATTPNFAATATGKFSHTRSSYDIQGQLWKSEVFNNVSNSFDETTYQYDLAGQRISTTNDNTTIESVYDALGRNYETRTLSATVVKSIQRQEYNVAGNVIAQESLTLNPNETTNISESGTNFVRRTIYLWYDKAGRQIVSADYGSGATIWTNAAKPTRPNTVPENSTETYLVTKYGYSPTTGRTESTTNPKGIVQQTFYDALGRVIKTLENPVTGGTNSDENVEIQHSYDGFDNEITIVAVNPTTGNQITKYLYEDSYNASLQTSAIYPDSSDTNSSGTDQVKTTYYLDGNPQTQTDQNGNVRTFSYDVYRRPIVDAVTTLGNGVDGTVRKIARNYTTRGTLEKVTSIDSQNAVLNEVKYEYDSNLQLKKLQQSHSDSVTTTTPCLEYSYDSAHNNRLSGVVYPSGKVLTYNYDGFDNVTSINEGTTPLVSYIYDGSGNPMQTTYNEPNVSLTYVNGGLDRYGRVINHSWVKNNNPLVHIIHSYDYDGNRTKRYDPVHAANSELYTYDNLGQIKSLNRGILNNDHTSVTTVNHSESWNFDKTGNWSQYTKNGNTENRTHNPANELQGIATHDANGNMILMPGLKGKYDAWNRLVEVHDSNDNLIASYEYNGLNQRIKKTVGTTVTKSFFNENWQEVESVTNDQVTSYVWGLRYIDDLILREKGNERLYSLADPNWNVSAICNETGNIQERMKYNAFGKITWLNTNFGTKNGSDYNWNRTFTGQALDIETGLMLYRNRYYHVELGRFVSRDPIGYDGNDENIYRYLQNVPIIVGDPLGLFAPGIDLSGMWPSSQPCCDGVPYDSSTHGCCDNKHIYNKSNYCCENNAVVNKESVWRCIRPINHPVAGQIGNWHSYMCCSGPNNNCFNFASGTHKGDSVPKEYITTGICTEYKVCPNKRKGCCDSPKAPWNYSFVTGYTCNAWTNSCVSD